VRPHSGQTNSLRDLEPAVDADLVDLAAPAPETFTFDALAALLALAITLPPDMDDQTAPTRAYESAQRSARRMVYHRDDAST
jgi:hypothetical protein